MASHNPIELRAQAAPELQDILSTEALAFVAELQTRFAARITEQLKARHARQARFDAGEKPDFLPETRSIREAKWTVSPLPPDLLDRRVEITGPVERKMIINALNSGAKVFMADFEDSNAPTWDNQIRGQKNLSEAIRRTISFVNEKGKSYALKEKIATLMVRPRGLHLLEKHAFLDGQPLSGALFDFGLYFFHNAKELLARGSGPYFYLPKMESHLEARIWNDVFVYSEERLGIPKGSIKATVLIETLPAAFELEEILYELREHSAGLNCGRWDYIFSFIKKLASDSTRVLPDRGQVGMDRAFLRAYSKAVIRVCHGRNVHAMGGMAAQIPIKDDPVANEAAMTKVRADKLREVSDGHDGTWVAHPGLVPIAMEIFDAQMRTPNQIADKHQDYVVTREDLLRVHEGTRTESGLRHNIRVGVYYLEAWLRGNGCVPIYNLMEDAATAEISRAQVWQWIRYSAQLDDGRPVTAAMFNQILPQEMERIKGEVGPERFASGKFADAAEMFSQLSLAHQFEDFLTVPAYERLLVAEQRHELS